MAPVYIGNAVRVRLGAAASLGGILVRDGRIAEVDPEPSQLPPNCRRIDARGRRLTAGLIDIHTHGIHEFSYEADPQSLIAGASIAARYGTTTVLPTLYKILNGNGLAKLETLAASIDQTANICIPGFHLEGPFLAIPGAGASTIPGDIKLLEEILAATQARVCAMSVSPECPNILPIIERLREREIVVFLTHTKASVDQTQAAIDAGARHATHFYDVFPVPEETEAGVRPVGAVETILADDRCTVDFICDGVHVDPMAIRAARAAKGASGIVAITDSNIGAGLGDGTYPTSWGYNIRVRRGDAARVDDVSHPLHGLLSGSSLTMDRAINNLRAWLRGPEHEIWAMGTRNPARVAELKSKGVLEAGADADFVLWDELDGQLHVAQTWVNGACVFDSAEQLDPLDEVRSHGQFVSV